MHPGNQPFSRLTNTLARNILLDMCGPSDVADTATGTTLFHQ